MNIIQQPDALSLSMNLKKFVLNADAQVSFVLKKGEEEILSQRYDPDSNGRIEIDVRDIVHAQLAYLLKEETLPYEQTGLCALFTAVIDEQEVSFTAVRGGVDRLADTATNFLTQNWLTWQPTVKPVTYYSPEFLTYSAVKAGVVKLKATLPDENNQSVDLAQLEAGKAYTIPVQYSTVVGKLGDKKPAYYDVWVEDAEGQRLTYIQRYYADAMRSISEDWVLFENSLGGIDCFRAYGATNLEAEHTHNLAEIDEVSEEYRVDTERKYQKNTGHLGKDEARWLLDFFPSQRKYIYTGSYLRQIVVVESDVTGNLRELPASYTFTYKYADARPLLNLPRTDVPADIPLSEGDLFPVQNPYSENWGTTTLGAIAEIIGQLLSTIAGGGGGVGHTHSNIELLNALSYIQEYLLVNGKKIKAGYADLAGDVEGDKFLCKYKPDSTSFLISFLAGLASKDIVFGEHGFATGMAGFGGKLDERGYGEMRGLTLWEWLQVPELRYNLAKIFIGIDWQVPGAGIIESCTPDTDAEGNILNTGTCTLKLESGQYGAIDVDDMSIGIWHFGNENDATEDSDDGKGGFTFAGFATSYFRITEVSGENNGTFRYSLRPGYTVHPQPQMNFACYGNFTNTERQTSTYRTRTYTRRLWKQNTWEIGPQNIASQDGDLSNLNVFGMNMTGYAGYMNSYYFTGTILQVKPDGTPIRTANDRGAWEAGHYDYYDRVSHNGCLWLCVNESGTDSEPSETSADWLKQVDKGQDGASPVNMGGWYSGLFVPYLGIVRMGGASWQCTVKNGTSNPPLWCWLDQSGNYFTFSDGNYVLTGEENTSEYTLIARDGTDGLDGVGIPGQDGKTYYTWLMYADDAEGNGISNSPEGKAYIGIANNRETPLESNDPSDYTWALIKGEDGIGIPGADGKTLYTWIAYSDNADGSGMYQQSKDTTKYIGVSPNHESATESDDPSDYVWSKFKGEKGDKGEQGDSVSNLGEWQSGMLVPYLGIVRMESASWQCINPNGTSNPPLWCWLDQNGNYLTYSDGGYALTGEKNTSDYELVAEDGKDGESIKGDPGIQGCIIRRGEWAIGVEWRNDESLTSGTRFLDVAMVRDNTTSTGWRAYKCKVTHTSATTNAPGTSGGASYWEEFAANVTSIFTSLIVAKNASIDFMQGNQLLIMKDDGTVTAGLSGTQEGGKTRIWAGSETPDNAPFRVDENGKVVMTNAEVHGIVNAIGGIFSNVQSANGSFVIDEDGNIQIVGKFSTSVNGTRIEIDPSTNKLIMYNQDGKEVCELFFLEESVGAITNYYPKLTLRRYSGDTLIGQADLSGFANLSMTYQNKMVNLTTDGLFFYTDGKLTNSYTA